jgi:hypothetical protein
VRPEGLEPPASGSVDRRSIQLSYGRVMLRSPNGIRTRATDVKGRCPGPLDDGGQVLRARDWNRTNDLLLRRQALYPLSYAGG